MEGEGVVGGEMWWGRGRLEEGNTDRGGRGTCKRDRQIWAAGGGGVKGEQVGVLMLPIWAPSLTYLYFNFCK